ncbi:uncharacterized protein LOC143213787 [Lasioglossum baleicum]|uniref:uncharacterized protein LOC143213787 n=1 Tax=Lasioglossum baleicum TaxID=434251 RepID=UPI003FCE5259
MDLGIGPGAPGEPSQSRAALSWESEHGTARIRRTGGVQIGCFNGEEPCKTMLPTIATRRHDSDLLPHTTAQQPQQSSRSETRFASESKETTLSLRTFLREPIPAIFERYS